MSGDEKVASSVPPRCLLLILSFRLINNVRFVPARCLYILPLKKKKRMKMKHIKIKKHVIVVLLEKKKKTNKRRLTQDSLHVLWCSEKHNEFSPVFTAHETWKVISKIIRIIFYFLASDSFEIERFCFKLFNFQVNSLILMHKYGKRLYSTGWNRLNCLSCFIESRWTKVISFLHQTMPWKGYLSSFAFLVQSSCHLRQNLS